MPAWGFSGPMETNDKTMNNNEYEHNMVKSPKWQETDQFIYKRARGVELGGTQVRCPNHSVMLLPHTHTGNHQLFQYARNGLNYKLVQITSTSSTSNKSRPWSVLTEKSSNHPHSWSKIFFPSPSS